MTNSDDKPTPLYVVLEQASLETAKTKKGFQILQADEHKSVLTKHNRDPSLYRPDIVHQMLMALLDSPLNKAGQLRVYIHTQKNVLIEVNPKIRLPRTFKRFCGLMVQLLHKLSIRASDGPEKLLKVVKNPISKHLPAGSVKIGFSKTGTLLTPRDFIASLPASQPVVLMLGAHAHGKAEVDWVEKYVAISSYPLSGATAVNRLLGEFEAIRNIL